eukprot:scaffold50011_cov14-Tisochrysis_lutea.AAC.1
MSVGYKSAQPRKCEWVEPQWAQLHCAQQCRHTTSVYLETLRAKQVRERSSFVRSSSGTLGGKGTR